MYILSCLPSAATFPNFSDSKCLKDPTCAIFFKGMGFKDIKYDIPVYQMQALAGSRESRDPGIFS